MFILTLVDINISVQSIEIPEKLEYSLKEKEYSVYTLTAFTVAYFSYVILVYNIHRKLKCKDCCPWIDFPFVFMLVGPMAYIFGLTI